jgi:carbon-monoxide dehydrogenase small subunit
MISFLLNGMRVESAADPLSRLVDVLRDGLGDASVKEGCGEGECGACAVLMNGRLVNSCLVPLAETEGAEIVTMAGLRETDSGRLLIRSFSREGAVQCGFCTPGFVLAAEALLRENPSPSDLQIREGFSGNLCRCTGYDLLVKAVAAAAREGRGLW